MLSPNSRSISLGPLLTCFIAPVDGHVADQDTGRLPSPVCHEPLERVCDAFERVFVGDPVQIHGGDKHVVF